MYISELSAISPIDGRYRSKVSGLSGYFSEFALIRYRVKVEIDYFIALCRSNLPELPSLSDDQISKLQALYLDFTEKDAEEVKKSEAVINHDVKAVEYFIKDKLEKSGLGNYKEYIHFGLTSQDINNTAVPLSLKDFLNEKYFQDLGKLVQVLKGMSEAWQEIPMLAYTHGQPASPTGLGKELRVFSERIENQFDSLKEIQVSGKFSGATGNFNAHYIAYPNIDWSAFADGFLHGLGLSRQQTTTQIEHYDQMAAIFDNIKRINTILIDLCRDIWSYVSKEYFKQKLNDKEVGSSTMPHKVNPIDFENAEGNLMIANSLFAFLSEKLPVSRLQRDLTDSTVLRNIGVPCAHTTIAIQSLLKGLGKLKINPSAINRDLENNWMVVAEAIQTVLRKKGIANPYELLKDLTRNNGTVNGAVIKEFINSLDIDDNTRNELQAITPFNYTGDALNKK